MKIYIPFVFLVLLTACGKEKPQDETPSISEEEMLVQSLDGNTYISDDLVLNSSECTGLMSILFSRTSEKKLIFAVADQNCNPVGNVLNFTVESGDHIKIYKLNTTDILFASLINFNENFFTFRTLSNDLYLFEKQ